MIKHHYYYQLKDIQAVPIDDAFGEYYFLSDDGRQKVMRRLSWRAYKRIILEEWMLDGIRHRYGGPAYTAYDGVLFYLFGRLHTKEEYEMLTSKYTEQELELMCETLSV